MHSPYKIVGYWLDASFAKRIKPKVWQLWADGLILKLTDPEIWIMDMSMAHSEDLLYKLYVELGREEGLGKLDGAVLGHYWERYKQGQISLRECLNEAGLYSDPYDVGIACEEFYELLNELEDTGCIELVEKKAEPLFASFHKIAEFQWCTLREIQPITL